MVKKKREEIDFGDKLKDPYENQYNEALEAESQSEKKSKQNNKNTENIPGEFEVLKPEADEDHRGNRTARAAELVIMGTHISKGYAVSKMAEDLFKKMEKELGIKNPFSDDDDLLQKAGLKMAKAEEHGADYNRSTPEDVSEALIDAMNNLASKALTKRGRTATDE